MMEYNIKDFHVAHQAIVNLFEQIQTSTRSYAEVKPKLRQLEDVLSGHLGKQDNAFFDRLSHLHKNDRKSVKMIEFLSEDIKNVKVSYLTFMEEHSGDMGDIGSNEFPVKFTKLLQEILDRFKIEEEYLFPLLEKIPN